jgi:hypothetical protein
MTSASPAARGEIVGTAGEKEFLEAVMAEVGRA